MISGQSSHKGTVALFVIAFTGWSGAWYAMKLQVIAMDPLVAVALRFMLAALIIFIIAAWRADPIRQTPYQHMQSALIGTFLFSTNFIFAYYATIYIPSALVAAILSLSSLLSLTLRSILNRHLPKRTEVMGALIGSLGLLALLWPQIQGAAINGIDLKGILYAFILTLCFSIGIQISSKAQSQRIPLLPFTAWSMAWGSMFTTLLACVLHRSWVIPLNLSTLGPFLFLVLFGTVFSFLAYNTLIKRLGAFKASSLNIIVPLGALIISTFYENIIWQPLTVLGALMLSLGNIIIFNPKLMRERT